MLDTSHDLEACSRELGCPVEQLLTPHCSTRRSEWFAIDNGAYAGFDRQRFLGLLARETDNKKTCRFVAVPDVVGAARRTLEVFDHWCYLLQPWPLALVAQDGIENLEIPWRKIAAIFIGGTTGWKMSKDAADVIRAAKAMGKWVHAGRVNTPGRFEYFEQLGADSIDGTGLSRYTWMRERIWQAHEQPRLV